MNKMDFTQPGGFPLDQDVLAFLQNNITLASAPATLGGDYCILSGCADDGSSVANGVVAIMGEVLPFVGGAKQAKVIIVENAQGLTFEDGITKQVQYTRYACFGDDGVTAHIWPYFKRNKDGGVLSRLESLEALNERLDALERVAAPFFQKGAIMLWNKPANLIPSGWREVADFRGRLPVGYNPADQDYNEPGKTGGSKTHKLSEANIAEHYHFTVVNDSIDTTWFPWDSGRYLTNVRSMITQWSKGNGSGKESYVLYGASNTFPSVQPNISPTSIAGRSNPDPVNHLNPYRVVLFIEYIGV
ncbi:hypothetical protein GFS24_10210 [Chitinophaga sp. SYP-B3965]|uniref:hypothetical protein n=1 Tax=Chitinophaga sp. SYP-B3965 TaxID=2663120 RepID=UPI0012997C5B|nr:hypothetical protein [Chitinophaga sp. SYP-B3965]MRG45490.1 hypothetical protein [Chitinophaga sp. SYP-B3965]